MSDKTFNALRHIAQLWLPALAALYFGISEIWGLPYAIEVVGTITVVDTFLGALLGYSRKKYEQSGEAYDGALVVEPRTNAPDVYNLEITSPLIDLPNKKQIVLKVQNALEDYDLNVDTVHVEDHRSQ